MTPLPPLELTRLLADIAAVAEAAGRDIMAIFRDESRWAVQHKEDDSPLTAADLAAHCLIAARLAALTPDLPVISEEAEAIAPATRLAWPRCWMVDPLDGTKEFISRSGEFTVNIALIEDGEAVLGVVHAPVSGVTYAAARGAGAWCTEGAAARPVRAAALPAPGAGVVRIVASRRHRGARDEAFCQAVQARFGAIDLRTAGSAFKICAVADGRADVYPRFGPTMEWDTAAGQVVLEEAGGLLVDEDGRPFRYNRRQSLLNGSFIAAGSAPELWPDLCAALPPA